MSVSQEEPDDLAERLRGSGYRLTPQRQLILRAVEDLGHATVDEVLARQREEHPEQAATSTQQPPDVREDLAEEAAVDAGGDPVAPNEVEGPNSR